MKTRTILSIVLLMAAAQLGRAQWKTPHANSANTSSAKVTTVPAAHIVGFADVGPVADGVNPVIGSDGTLYIGNTRGELIALFPNGTQFWKRQLDSGYGGIFTSPVIGQDGCIYVVSRAIYTDSNGYKHPYSYLHKFSPASAWLNVRTFPLQNPAFPDWVNAGGNSGAPNVGHFNGMEVILVPVWYSVFSNFELRLIAFSTTDLHVVATKTVTTLLSGDITADTGDIYCHYFPFPCFTFNSPIIPFANWPTPDVAIWENPAGPNYIWVADNKRDTVAYQLNVASGFLEILRFSDAQNRRSSPPVALDTNFIVAAVGTEYNRLEYENANMWTANLGVITAPPTRLWDGRLVVIDSGGGNALMRVVSGAGPTFDPRNIRVTAPSQLNGGSIAAPAASCNHLFVASANEFVTYDLTSMTPLVRISWSGGGHSAPVIGPTGYVYGLTSFGLFVFSPPSTQPIGGCQQQVVYGGPGIGLE
jgi:hypothetical protein